MTLLRIRGSSLFILAKHACSCSGRHIWRINLRRSGIWTITARRIDIVEPNGTVRLTISNRADFPRSWNGGRNPRPDRRDAAGMLFMSEEGTEQGGSLWAWGNYTTAPLRIALSQLRPIRREPGFCYRRWTGGKGTFSRLKRDRPGKPPDDEEKVNEAIEKGEHASDKSFATHKSDVKRIEVKVLPPD